MKSKTPDLRAGQTVRIKQKIKEGDKEFFQIFEGLVIKVHKAGLRSTVTVRKVSEWIWVEKIFLIHSPLLEEIEVIKVAKVRRAKLYHMRSRFGKSARLKEKQTTASEREKMMIQHKEEKVEKAENKKEEAPAEEIKN